MTKTTSLKDNLEEEVQRIGTIKLSLHVGGLCPNDEEKTNFIQLIRFKVATT